MSLQFSGHGTREGVLKKLSDSWPAPVADGKDDKLPVGSDRKQVESVRTIIAAEVAALEPKVNGVRVIAEADAQPNIRRLSITIVPQDLSV